MCSPNFTTEMASDLIDALEESIFIRQPSDGIYSSVAAVVRLLITYAVNGDAENEAGLLVDILSSDKIRADESVYGCFLSYAARRLGVEKEALNV